MDNSFPDAPQYARVIWIKSLPKHSKTKKMGWLVWCFKHMKRSHDPSVWDYRIVYVEFLGMWHFVFDSLFLIIFVWSNSFKQFQGFRLSEATCLPGRFFVSKSLQSSKLVWIPRKKVFWRAGIKQACTLPRDMPERYEPCQTSDF